MSSAPGTGPRRRTAAPPKDLVRAQARRMVDVARIRFGDRFGDLTRDPCEALAGWDEIDFRLVPQPATTTGMDDDAGCSVAGAYLEITDPQGHRDQTLPIVQVARAASLGRRSFTALHELGHHLQRTDIDLAGVLWDQQALDMFEDLACDAFAADMLLPERAVDTVIDTKGPTAGDVVALYERSGASRSAVCVRAAQRLASPGHVLLLNEDGTVFFAAAAGMPPLRKRSDQSRMDVVARGLRGGSSRGRGRFVYRDGIEGDELFVQTAALDGFLVVVAVVDRAPWEKFALPSRDVGPRASSYECADPACGATYVSFEPRCPKCQVAPCRDCGRCPCQVCGVGTESSEKTCSNCWQVKNAAGFVGELCVDCA